MFSTMAVFLRRRASLIEMKRPVPASRPRWVVFFFATVALLARVRDQEQLSHARIPDRADSVAELFLRHRKARCHFHFLAHNVHDHLQSWLVLKPYSPRNLSKQPVE